MSNPYNMWEIFIIVALISCTQILENINEKPVHELKNNYIYVFRNHLPVHHILHKESADGAKYHENTGHYERADGIIVKYIPKDQPAEDTIHDLRDGDRHVEQPHKNPHLFRWDGICQHGIRHSQYAAPGDPDADHRDDKETVVGEDQERDERKTADGQSKSMGGFTPDARCHFRQQQGDDSRYAIVNPKENTYPVAGFLVTCGGGVGGSKEMTGHRRCGVNPHRKEGKP